MTVLSTKLQSNRRTKNHSYMDSIWTNWWLQNSWHGIPFHTDVNKEIKAKAPIHDANITCHEKWYLKQGRKKTGKGKKDAASTRKNGMECGTSTKGQKFKRWTSKLEFSCGNFFFLQIQQQAVLFVTNWHHKMNS